ncbi:MAG: preprotein translocase subunit SecG [Deltaproteobacteria bacterium]|jgi:preprotein translocase subunit SecG|nr:preprotein translocase subunit SecG [Deltaproteobacteria bacterium]MDH4007699.1 preprotein translocase subunit SecG [Desulfuromonadales bacterium]
MNYILLSIHILVCLSLIGIVLIQGGKGAEVGAAFGAGASNTIFGASGGQSFIAKMTAGAAVIFMLTSLALAIFWGQPGSSSVMPDQIAPASAPASMPAQSIPPAAPSGETK